MVLILREGYWIIEHVLCTDNNSYADIIFNWGKKVILVHVDFLKYCADNCNCIFHDISKF